MAEALPSAASSPDEAPEAMLHPCVERLRELGAASFDPVNWRVIEVMLRRLEGFAGPARAAGARRIARRLTDFRQRFERAGGVPRPAADQPALADEASRAAALPDGRDESSGGTAPAGGLDRAPDAAATVQSAPVPGPLAALLAHVARHPGDACGEPVPYGTPLQPAAELKSVRYFRSTWSRLSLEQQLSRARAGAPENAGPLNSHHLALQALIRMRDIAPQYLEGFIAHVDALLWLQQAEVARAAASRSAAQKPVSRKGDARAQGGRSRKPSRGTGD